jgi:hypothetical protein
MEKVERDERKRGGREKEEGERREGGVSEESAKRRAPRNDAVRCRLLECPRRDACTEVAALTQVQAVARDDENGGAPDVFVLLHAALRSGAPLLQRARRTMRRRREGG